MRKIKSKKLIKKKNPELNDIQKQLIKQITSSITNLPKQIPKLEHLTTSQAMLINRLFKQINEVIDFAYKSRIGK